jgi:hypothetical protein
MELRLLLAFILMGVVLFVTPYFYKTVTPPVKKTAPASTTSAPAPAPPAALRRPLKRPPLPLLKPPIQKPPLRRSPRRRKRPAPSKPIFFRSRSAIAAAW